MATGYQYRMIDGFSTLELTEIGEEWQSNTQFALSIQGNDDTVHSMIRFLGISDNPHFQKYFVRHETQRSQMVRFGGEYRSSYIAVEDFYLYIPMNQSYLYATTNTQVLNELLRRVKTSHSCFSFETHEVDLAKIKALFLSDLRGGWFKDLRIDDVSTAAIFGPKVGDSVDWERYENSGEISALTIEFSYEGFKHSIQITKTGTIVLYENFREGYAIDLVERVNDIILKFIKSNVAQSE